MARLENFLLTPAALYLFAGSAVALTLYLLARADVASNVGSAVGGALVDITDGVVTGAVKGVGGVFGVPDTNQTECERALAEGRKWDASFACDAKTFLDNMFGGSRYKGPPSPYGRLQDAPDISVFGP